MDLRGPILHFQVPVERTRHAASTKVKGIYTKGSATTETVQLVHQPMNLEQREAMPEGERDSSLHNIWSANEILSDDIFTINGEPHRVMRRSIRQDGQFWRAIVGDTDGGQ